jgi:hypothetical protein
MPIEDVQDLARMIVELEDHLLRRLEESYAEGQEPA